MRFLVLVGLSLPLAGQAVSTQEAHITALSHVHLKNGDLHGCAVGISATTPGSLSRRMYGSVTLMDPGYVAIKGTFFEIQQRGPKPPETGTQAIPIKSFWLKAPSQERTAPIPGAKVLTQVDHSMLYSTTAVSGSAVMRAALEQAPIEMGVVKASNDEEIVLSGQVKMSPHDQQQLRDCVARLISRLKKQ